MKNNLYLCLIFISIFVCCGEENQRIDFQIVIISDVHVSNDDSKIDRLHSFIDQINHGKFPAVEMLAVTGDVVSCVYGSYRISNPDTSDNRVHKALNIFSKSNIPVHFVLGNHDYKIGRDRDSDTYFPEIEILEMEKIWHKQAGIRPYYSRDYEGWNFIFLNSMRGRYLNRHFDDKQLIWLEKELLKLKPTILLFHHPLKTDNIRIWCKPKDLIKPDGEPEFYRILSDYRKNIKGIFVGHGHMWGNDKLFDEIEVYETASFGDATGQPFYLVGFTQADSSINVVAY
jgi:Icc-related predicted phosphoesterase